MYKELLSICPHVRENVPLSELTTFKVGGPAEFVAKPETPEQAAGLQKRAEEMGLPVYFLGRGSDILASDDGVRGLIIHTAGLTGLSVHENGKIEAGSGISLPELARAACGGGFSGLEWAAGIPGSVGGGVLLNAGAYGGQMADVCQLVRVWDGGAVREITDHRFGYRRSIYGENPEWLILNAAFQLKPDDKEAIAARMESYREARREKQPLELPSAGSFFKRPEGHFAGALIEQCGLKGLTEGGAQVSPKHAGFIVNTGGAACRDILRLAEIVHKTVLRETGVRLEPEVRLLGDVRWNF